MENREKHLEQKVEQIQKEQSRNIENSKRERKGLFTRIGAAIAACAILITGFVHIKKNKNNSKNNKPTHSMVEALINPETQISINGLGVMYKDPVSMKENPQYGNTTGNIKEDELTEKNGITWKDKDAANNSSNVGKIEIDDKNGTLQVKPNGDAFVKDEGYEIEKEDGTVIEGTITEQDKQNGNTLPGYVHDENLNKDVVEEDNNKFVYCDANYYDSTGTLVYAKGELISKEDLQLAKQFLTTTKPVIETQPEVVVPEETFVPTQGIVNHNGTYTIDGLTFESKADYEQWIIQGYEGYGIDLDGIMKPESEIIENYNQKTK